jgi:hypothetical protein
LKLDALEFQALLTAPFPASPPLLLQNPNLFVFMRQNTLRRGDINNKSKPWTWAVLRGLTFQFLTSQYIVHGVQCTVYSAQYMQSHVESCGVMQSHAESSGVPRGPAESVKTTQSHPKSFEYIQVHLSTFKYI